MAKERASDWFSDTDPKALEVFLDLQRKMSPSEKLERVFKANAMMHSLADGRPALRFEPEVRFSRFLSTPITKWSSPVVL